MASHTPKDLVEYLARGIVTQPDAVRVVPVDGGRGLELETTQEDRGRGIGRQGRIAKALRAVLAASRSGGQVRLDIVD